MRKLVTDEQRVAKKIADLVANLTIDIELIGSAIAQAYPNVIINRILLMAEVLKEEKDTKWTHKNALD
jgi:hypothetical protein